MPAGDLRADLARDGYTVIDLLDAPLVGRLLATFDAVAERYRGGFSATMLNPDLEHRRRLHGEIEAALGPLPAVALPGHRAVSWGFVVKELAGAGAMPLHQDITVIDPAGPPGLSVWAPLVDVGPENGCLEVVPGSHRLNRHARAPGSPFPCPHLEAEIRGRLLRPLPLRAGQAVVLDQATFHCSPPSRAPRPRPVLAGIVVPREQPLRYYHRALVDGDAWLEAFEVDDDFYLGHVLGTRPAAGRPLSVEPERVAGIRADDLGPLQRREIAHPHGGA